MSKTEDRMYFSDEQAFSTPSTPNSKGAGAQLYASYMSDIHSRRLRKAKTPPPSDAAGLVYGTKYHGRTTPVKGHGIAPPDNRQAPWMDAKTQVPGRSHVAVKDLLAHQDGSQPAPGSPDPTLRASFRSCAKTVGSMSFKTALAGAGLEIVSEEPVVRKLAKSGTFAPTRSTARILCIQTDEEATAAAAEDVPLSKWSTQMIAAQAVEEAMTAKRPQTAPGQHSDSRKHYHEAMISNQDVFRYRHSGGICPDEYKFDSVRVSAPALVLPPTGSAKDVFFDTRASYSFNRVRGLTSSPLY